jgi:hypothetical protein
MNRENHRHQFKRSPKRPQGEDHRALIEALEKLKVETRCGLDFTSWLIGYARIINLESRNMKFVKHACIGIMTCTILYNFYLAITMNDAACARFGATLLAFLIICRLLAKVWLAPWNTRDGLKIFVAFLAVVALAFLESFGPLLTPHARHEIEHVLEVAEDNWQDWKTVNWTEVAVIGFEFCLPLLYTVFELFEAMMDQCWQKQIHLARAMRFGPEHLSIETLFNRVYILKLQTALLGTALGGVVATVLWFLYKG